MPRAGARVVVPVGPRTLTGVVLGEAAAADTAYTIKPIKQVLDDHAFVPPDVVKLTEWVSEYYLAGPGATLAAALPPHGLTRAHRSIQDRPRRGADGRRHLMPPSGSPRTAPKPPSCRRLGKRQVEALHLLKGAPDGLTTPAAGRARHHQRDAVAAEGAGPGRDSRRADRSRSVRARGLGDQAAGAARRDARSATRARDAAAAGRRAGVPRRARSRRDRQRQDRGLLAARRCGPATRPRRADARARRSR